MSCVNSLTDLRATKFGQYWKEMNMDGLTCACISTVALPPAVTEEGHSNQIPIQHLIHLAELTCAKALGCGWTGVACDIRTCCGCDGVVVHRGADTCTRIVSGSAPEFLEGGMGDDGRGREEHRKEGGSELHWRGSRKRRLVRG